LIISTRLEYLVNRLLLMEPINWLILVKKKIG
jgi:hypothetical protein